MSLFPINLNHHWKCREQKEILQTILVIISWNFSAGPIWNKKKRNSISSITNLLYQLPHELPNDLRIRILGNLEILEKSQIRVEAKPSAYSPVQKLNFAIAVKNLKKVDQTFLVPSYLTGFLFFVPYILSGTLVLLDLFI